MRAGNDVTKEFPSLSSIGLGGNHVAFTLSLTTIVLGLCNCSDVALDFTAWAVTSVLTVVTYKAGRLSPLHCSTMTLSTRCSST